jgi:hypothetical protein
VWRATAKKRMAAKLLAIKAELTRRRHEPKAAVGEWLQKVVLGYYRYHRWPMLTLPTFLSPFLQPSKGRPLAPQKQSA